MKRGVEPRTFLLLIFGGCIVGSLIGMGCLIFDVEILRKKRAEEIRNDRLFIFIFPVAVTLAYIFALLIIK